MVVVLLAATAGWAAADNRSDGTRERIEMKPMRSNMDFHRVDISDAIRLIVEERTDGNIVVRADREIMPYVCVSVSGGTLRACIKSGTLPRQMSGRSLAAALPVEVRIPDNGRIDGIEVSTASSFVARPLLKAGRMKIGLSGASSAELNVEADSVEADISGASNIALGVECRRVSLDVSGASKATLTGRCEEGEADVSGVSLAELKCDGSFDVDASGVSSIVYSAACKLKSACNSGQSSIKQLK